MLNQQRTSVFPVKPIGRASPRQLGSGLFKICVFGFFIFLIKGRILKVPQVACSWLNIKGFLLKCSDASQPVIIALIFLRSESKNQNFPLKKVLFLLDRFCLTQRNSKSRHSWERFCNCLLDFSC